MSLKVKLKGLKGKVLHMNIQPKDEIAVEQPPSEPKKKKGAAKKVKEAVKKAVKKSKKK